METIKIKKGNIALFKRKNLEKELYFISKDGFSIVGDVEQELINPPLFFLRLKGKTIEELTEKFLKEEKDIINSFLMIDGFEKDYKIIKLLRLDGEPLKISNNFYEKIIEFAYLGVHKSEELKLINFEEKLLNINQM